VAFVSESQLRVRYAETDAMGVVYHANYLVWFEVGRGDYMRQIGMEYAAIEAGGHILAVSEAGARYVASARYSDLVTVRTWLEEVRSRTITFRYEVRLIATDQVLVTGFTRHICVDRAGRVTALPTTVRDMLVIGCNAAPDAKSRRDPVVSPTQTDTHPNVGM
jgi:acyl-CoA thioester hydrolase